MYTELKVEDLIDMVTDIVKEALLHFPIDTCDECGAECNLWIIYTIEDIKKWVEKRLRWYI